MFAPRFHGGRRITYNTRVFSLLSRCLYKLKGRTEHRKCGGENQIKEDIINVSNHHETAA